MKLHAPQTAKTISYDLSDNSDLMRSTMARPPRIVAYAHCPSDFEAKLWRPGESPRYCCATVPDRQQLCGPTPGAAQEWLAALQDGGL